MAIGLSMRQVQIVMPAGMVSRARLFHPITICLCVKLLVGDITGGAPAGCRPSHILHP